jgi:hypothetical protein
MRERGPTPDAGTAVPRRCRGARLLRRGMHRVARRLARSARTATRSSSAAAGPARPSASCTGSSASRSTRRRRARCSASGACTRWMAPASWPGRSGHGGSSALGRPAFRGPLRGGDQDVRVQAERFGQLGGAARDTGGVQPPVAELAHPPGRGVVCHCGQCGGSHHQAWPGPDRLRRLAGAQARARATDPPGGIRSSRRSRVMAASIRARCVNACGKLPICSPVSPISSE